MSEERIIAAALRDEQTGLVLFHEVPGRHHNVMWSLDGYGMQSHGLAQGFVTSTGRFVDREEAFTLASAAGQLIAVHRAGELFSEDLW